MFLLLQNRLDDFVDLLADVDQEVRAKTGGRPLDVASIFLAREIGIALEEILDVAPKSTEGGTFSNAVHLAFQLVRGPDEAEDCSRYVKRAIADLKMRA